jgi:16S rRNA (guanine527-N7)-methyltransferase
VSDELAALRVVLEDARTAGFLGPGPVEPQLDHARAFAAVVEGALGGWPTKFCDLGTGGGVPGLVLALEWRSCTGVFVESNRRRSAALRAALERLGLEGRVRVEEQRAELVARDPRFREQFPVVTARSFAEPPVTAEIAAGLVALGGVLVVSEPPIVDAARWPEGALADLGFGPALREVAGERHFVVVVKDAVAPTDVPRGIGRPAKRPRW